LKSRKLISFFVPSGLLLLLVAVAVTQVNAPPAAYSVVRMGFYVVEVAAIFLAARFRSTRVVSTLLFICLLEEASASPSFGAAQLTIAITALLPINFVTFSLLPERGYSVEALVPRVALLLIDFVALGVTGRQPPGTVQGFHIPTSAMLTCGMALLLFVVRFVMHHRPIESGFFWSLAALALALGHSGADQSGTGVSRMAYMGAASAILGLSMIETSYFLAYNDELTGLPSRRAFNEAIARLENFYSIAVVDVDHFKNFNDQYGHDTGDQVLRMVAARLAGVSGGGQSFRCGGEEFVIIFPDKPAFEVLDHLERLRLSIEDAKFSFRASERRQSLRGQDRRKMGRTPGKKTGQQSRPLQDGGVAITVSIGLAERGQKIKRVDQVLAEADKALYRAKGNGRNRVEVAGIVRDRNKMMTRLGAMPKSSG